MRTKLLLVATAILTALGLNTTVPDGGDATAAVLARTSATPAEATPIESVHKAAAGSTTPAVADNLGGTTGGWFTADSGNCTRSAPVSTTATIDVGEAYHPAPEAIYRDAREAVRGDRFGCRYDGLTAGALYVVRLHFAELTAGAARSRVFDVAVNGVVALDDYAIGRDAGYRTAVVKPINTRASGGGTVTITFTSRTGNAIVNGIEIVAGAVRNINAGGAPAGGYTAPDQRVGTGTSRTGQPIDTGLVHSPGPRSVYQTARWGRGTWSYTITGLAPGASHSVRLHFAELTYRAAGQRVFHVRVNEAVVLKNLDPWQAGGGRYVASSRQVVATSSAGGSITITFVSVAGSAAVNGIEVSPRASFAFNAGGPAVAGYDAELAGYRGSAGPLGGDSTDEEIDTSGLTDPAPEALYRTHRRGGDFWYTLPGLVPDAPYTIRLHFAEFGDAACGAGARTFDIRLNGVLVAPAYDVFVAAGNTCRKAVIRDLTYYADAAGSIQVKLTGVRGEAMLSGLQVFGSTDVAAGYSVKEIGIAGQPPTVLGRDGGSSALVGDKVLWFWGDTPTGGPTDDGTTPPNVTWWMDTGSLTEPRRPWQSIEALDSNGRVNGELVPMDAEEYDYNVAHFWCSPPSDTCNHTRYVTWPGSVIRQADGSGLIFTEVLGSPFEQPAPPDRGVITYPIRPGQLPGSVDSPVAPHPVLFPARTERPFSNAFVAPDGYVYNYATEGGAVASLTSGLSAGVEIDELRVTGVNRPMYAGQRMQVADREGNVQAITIATDVDKSATTVDVVPVTPGRSFPAEATHVEHPGCGDFCSVLFLARARLSPVGNPAQRESWTFWNQRLNQGAGGWDASAAAGTSLPVTGGVGITAMVNGPSVAWNEHVGKYVMIYGRVLGNEIQLRTADTPQGPWSTATLVAKVDSGYNFNAYFVLQHEAMALGNGQTIYVSYNHSSDPFHTRIVEVLLPNVTAVRSRPVR